MAVRTYTPAELRQAHADLCTAFIAPGSCMPADIHTALEDDLWSRLITARAASNRFTPGFVPAPSATAALNTPRETPCTQHPTPQST